MGRATEILGDLHPAARRRAVSASDASAAEPETARVSWGEFFPSRLKIRLFLPLQTSIAQNCNR